MGLVFLGETPGGRKVAVKLIRPDFGQDAQFRERFAREVEAARRVGGFHTAMVVDADPHADPPWMATAFIEGASLADKVARGGPLQWREVRELGAALAEGLAAIHAHGLVHRDLKPGNVIMAYDGPRIIDFGIARADGQTALTTVGHVFGTPPYMSPEQLAGDTAGPASDVFALGGVLAFAVTGRPPFGNGPGLTERIITQAPDLNGIDHAPLRRLIADCLAKSPRDQPTLSAILTALAHHSLPPVIVAASPIRTLASPGVFKIAFSPDGRLLASDRTEDGTDVPDDGTITLWDPASGKQRGTLAGHREPFAFSPDGRLLAARYDFGRIRLWDLASGKHCPLAGHAVLTAMAFSPDRRLLASGATDGTVRLWDLASGECRHILAGHKKTFEGHFLDAWVNVVAFSPDSRLLAAGYDDGTLRLWDPISGERQWDLTGDKYEIRTLAFSPDGRLLATGGGETVRLWNPASGERRRTLASHTHGAAVAFSPDGRLLAAGHNDGTLRLWDPISGERLQAMTTGGITALAFSPDGRFLATAENGERIRLWPINPVG
jgi:hypothetical protein